MTVPKRLEIKLLRAKITIMNIYVTFEMGEEVLAFLCTKGIFYCLSSFKKSVLLVSINK
jgi:hypothetical protein